MSAMHTFESCGHGYFTAVCPRCRKVGAVQPDGAPPERIDFELCQRIGKAARDAAGRFAHLISGATAPDPVATDEYVGLAILRELGARLPEPGRTAE